MQNITFSAQEQLIQAAREKARSQQTTLNEAFREWLAVYARQPNQARHSMSVIRELQSRGKSNGRKFSRDEMNER